MCVFSSGGGLLGLVVFLGGQLLNGDPSNGFFLLGGVGSGDGLGGVHAGNTVKAHNTLHGQPLGLFNENPKTCGGGVLDPGFQSGDNLPLGVEGRLVRLALGLFPLDGLHQLLPVTCGGLDGLPRQKGKEELPFGEKVVVGPLGSVLLALGIGGGNGGFVERGGGEHEPGSIVSGEAGGFQGFFIHAFTVFVAVAVQQETEGGGRGLVFQLDGDGVELVSPGESGADSLGGGKVGLAGLGVLGDGVRLLGLGLGGLSLGLLGGGLHGVPFLSPCGACHRFSRGRCYMVDGLPSCGHTAHIDETRGNMVY